MSTKITGAQALIRSLEREGVEMIFGYPGAATIPIHDILHDATPIRHILVRHEQGAAHMADGYARASGKVGVCLATSGPGATNLVTGIATAYMDSIPMVAITGQVDSRLIGTDAFQEVDTTGITLPIVKHSYLVKDPRELPRIVKEAFHIASTGRRGPVLIDIPKDISIARIPERFPERVSLRSCRPSRNGHHRQLIRAMELIAKAERPLIYVGGGVIASGAASWVRALAERIGAPVAHTLMGKGAFPESHPLSLGMLGMHGMPAANFATAECDLLLALGARFDDRVTGKLEQFAPHAQVVHIDVDPAEIGKNVAPSVPIVGELAPVLEALLEQLPQYEHPEWLEKTRRWKESYPMGFPESDALLPQFVLRELHRVTEGKAIIVTDVGQNQMWAAQFYPVERPRQFLSSGGLGTMGFGLPAAIGAQFARPDDLVVAVVGDGGFQMTIQELIVAAEHRLPIKVVLLNNGYLGMVRQWQELFFARRYAATDISFQPDFMKLAEGYGAEGILIERPEQVRPALERALSISDRPCILDFRIAREEKVLPMIPAGGSVRNMLLPEGYGGDRGSRRELLTMRPENR